MQQQTHGRCGTHRLRHLEERSKDRLGELVGLGIRDNEEDNRRDERVLGLQHDVHDLYLLMVRFIKGRIDLLPYILQLAELAINCVGFVYIVWEPHTGIARSPVTTG